MSEMRAVDPRSEAIIAAYQEVVLERLDEGLRAMQQSAIKSMHEVAREVWRTTETDEEDLKDRLLAELSKDQAIRGMLTHTDERFQSLAVRVAAIEDNLAAMSQAARDLRDAVQRKGLPPGAGTAAEAPPPPAIDKEEIIESIAPLAEEIRREANRSAIETREWVTSLEGNVRESIEAVGRLSEVVQDQIVRLDAIAAREAAEGAEAEAAPQPPSPEEIASAVGEALTDKVNDGLKSLAAMIRSDNTKMAALLKQASEEGAIQASPKRGVDRNLAELLDARLGRMSELVSATTMSAVNEIARKIPEARNGNDAAPAAANERLEEMMMSIDRGFVNLTDTLESQLRRMGHAVAEHTSESVDRSIADRMNANLERLSNAVQELESHPSAPGPGSAEERDGGLDEATGADIAAIVDDRLTQLAKMIRADNKAIAGAIRLGAQQEEMLPTQIANAIEKRLEELSERQHKETQATVEAIAAMADALARRIDRATMSVHERFDRATKRPPVRRTNPAARPVKPR